MGAVSHYCLGGCSDLLMFALAIPALSALVHTGSVSAIKNGQETQPWRQTTAVAGGKVAHASRPAQEQPNAKRAKCEFVGDVDMPQAVNESYENWAHWRDHVAATFGAFIGDDLAAKKATEHHVELMHRGLGQAGVDMATECAAPSAKPHKANLMMGLYENHARCRLDVIGGEWNHINLPAPALA